MQGDTINSFEKFLNYGPIGLAGLMLVLVIFAMTIQKPSPGQASFLKFFMVIGAICFLATLAAEFFAPKSSHRMSVFVAPNNFQSNSGFPPPIIRFNGEVLSKSVFNVSEAGSLLIDVTQSVGVFSAVKTEAQSKSMALNEVTEANLDLKQNVENLTAQLEVREVALVKAQELSTQLINSVGQIRQEATTNSSQLSPNAQRSLREINSIQRDLNKALGVLR